MNFNVINLGCKVNAFEAESTARTLEQNGYIRNTEDESSDITIIFTCAVTNMAAQKSRKMIHRAKRNNPNSITIVAGCYSQIDPESLQEADILIGTKNKSKLLEYLETYQKNHERIVDIEKVNVLPFENMFVDHFDNQTRAYLKIQDGCNQFCTYCVIPFARGRERSMAKEDVIKSVLELQKSHSEIVLSGIHTGRYGRDAGITLADLLEELLKVSPNDFRFRISSIEVTEIDDHLISLMQNDKRIAKHFHIPLQSGSDGVLKRMGRPYTKKEFLERLHYIREKVPGVSISTDLIVGFPQESEEEFEETCNFLKECEFSFLHVFPYSMRTGTKAADMKGHIDPKVKKSRASSCANISEELYDKYKEDYLDKEVTVLFEKFENGYSFGHSSEYLPILVKGEYPRSSFRKVKITELKDHQLYGEIL
jgi:threonylcarbamoyladenosine tRNA methylthiotransferase MtaB